MAKKIYTSKDGEITVKLDKNGQICGGTYFSTHKGRPCLIEGNTIYAPVTTMVYDEKLRKDVMVFDYYEPLIEGFKIAK